MTSLYQGGQNSEEEANKTNSKRVSLLLFGYWMIFKVEILKILITSFILLFCYQGFEGLGK